MKINIFAVSSKKASQILLIITSLLIIASVAGQVMKYIFGHDTVFGLVPLFNVSQEQNIPTLFSVLLLISCSVLLSLIFYLHRKQDAKLNVYWIILAMGFVYMAIDEFAQLHENLGISFIPLIGDHSHGFLYYSWVIPAFALIIFLALFFSNFLFKLPKATRISFIIAGVIYLTGLLGIEMLGGSYHELHGKENLTYSLISTLEESLEMLGLILFIRALLDYLSAHFSEITINFQR